MMWAAGLPLTTSLPMRGPANLAEPPATARCTCAHCRPAEQPTQISGSRAASGSRPRSPELGRRDRDRTAMRGDDLAHDVEPEPEALHRTAALVRMHAPRERLAERE